MAHELEIQNGKASMMYVGEVPWHGLGIRLDKPATAAQAIKAAGLDWEVEKVPLAALDTRSQTLLHVPERFAVVRRQIWHGDAPPDARGQRQLPGMFSAAETSVLGVVGPNYRPLQNRDAFKFFDEIVGEDEAIYHTAGSLGRGERVWILAKLPGTIEVIGDDHLKKYLLLSNSHDGSSSVQIKFTPVRVVCQNTLSLALSQGRSVRVTHDADLMRNLGRAADLLGIIRQRFDDAEVLFRALASVQMSTARLDHYLETVFPAPRSAERGDDWRRAIHFRNWSRYFFDNGAGNDSAGVKGTLWAAYNGITEYVDHRQNRRGAERRFESVFFSEGHSIKTRALAVAQDLLKTWRN